MAFTNEGVLDCLADTLSLRDLKNLALVNKACRDRTRAGRLRAVKISDKCSPPATIRKLAERVIIENMFCSLRLAAWPALQSTALRVKGQTGGDFGSMSSFTAKCDYQRKQTAGEGEMENLPRASQRLTSRDVSRSLQSAQWANALAQISLVHEVRELTIFNTALGDAGARLLARGRWQSLCVLSLWNNSIGPDGAQALASCDMPHLSVLNVSWNQLGSQGARALSSSHWSHTLVEVHLCNAAIGNNGIEALVESEWPLLAVLNLAHNGIKGAEGMELFARGKWPSLLQVSFEGNILGEEGVEALARAELSRSMEVVLAGNGIGGEAVRASARADWQDVTLQTI